MITILWGALVLLIVTSIHESGHWLGVLAKRGRVLRLQVGRGVQVWRGRREPPEVVLALLPLGGRIQYDGVPSGTGQAVVAVSGAVANLTFAVVGFLGVWALADGGATLPAGDGDGPIDYALRAAGGWFWAVPGAVRDLLTTGMATELNRAVGEAVSLLSEPRLPAIAYVASAASATWAALNLIPVPGLRTDGWLALSALWRAARSRMDAPPSR